MKWDSGSWEAVQFFFTLISMLMKLKIFMQFNFKLAGKYCTLMTLSSAFLYLKSNKKYAIDVKTFYSLFYQFMIASLVFHFGTNFQMMAHNR